MHKKIAFLILGLLLTLTFFMLTWDKTFKYFPTLPKLNYIFYDASLKLFHRTTHTDNVVIVDIDEKSLRAQGKWPWPRNKVAQLAAALQKDNAAVIAFDILYPEEDLNVAKVILHYAASNPRVPQDVNAYLQANIATFDNDKTLADTIAKGDIVLGVFFSDELANSVGILGEPLIKLDPAIKLSVPAMTRFTGVISTLLTAGKHTGFTTTIPDEDGVVRRTPLLIKYDDGLYPSLALEAVRLYLLSPKVNLDYERIGDYDALLGLRLANIYIPTDPSGKMLIPYIGPAFSFSYYSASDVMQQHFKPGTFSDKIVVVGASAIGIGDLHSVTLQSAGFPGAEVHATVIDTILSQSFISSPAWMLGLERIIIVIGGIIFTLLLLFSPVYIVLIITLLGELFVFGLQAVLWKKWGLIFPHIIIPYLQILLLGIANAVYGYLFESRYRKKLQDVYGQYVSRDYIDRMVENPQEYTLAGRSKTMSVLFSDIRSFTSISEKLDAAGVKDFLNSLFTPLTEIIFENKGTIDKYVGDMVMAFWNDPIDDPNHAQHAVEAGMRMIAKVESLAPFFAAKGIPSVRIGVGVNTGIMNVGDMGSKYRKTYTVLGDSVNLASRLESANKFYGTRVLVSQDSMSACNNIVFRFVDKVMVKGKKIPIQIYEPLCHANDKPSCLDEEFNKYAKALELYYANDFCAAKNAFDELVVQYPNVPLYKVYQARLAKFIDVCPPHKEWGGAYVLDEK
jgi:adenylate cyclase